MGKLSWKMIICFEALYTGYGGRNSVCSVKKAIWSIRVICTSRQNIECADYNLLIYMDKHAMSWGCDDFFLCSFWVWSLGLNWNLGYKYYDNNQLSAQPGYRLLLFSYFSCASMTRMICQISKILGHQQLFKLTLAWLWKKSRYVEMINHIFSCWCKLECTTICKVQQIIRQEHLLYINLSQ